MAGKANAEGKPTPRGRFFFVHFFFGFFAKSYHNLSRSVPRCADARWAAPRFDREPINDWKVPMTYIERQTAKARRDKRRQSKINARKKRARLAAGTLCDPKKGGA